MEFRRVLFRSILIPGLIIPGIIFTGMALYPFIEAWATGDKREHHLLDRPRNAPTRTAIGAMSLTFMVVSLINGGNDLIATHFHLSINQIMWGTRISIILLPPLAYIITKRVCLSLQRYDRELVLHGRETGRLVMLPHGEYIEVHEPISPEKAYTLTQHEQAQPLPAPEVDANGVAPRGGIKSRIRTRLSKALSGEQIAKPTSDDVKALEGGHH